MHYRPLEQFYAFDGRAFFSGDTHRTRHRDRALNSGHLKEVRKDFFGANFIVEVSDDGLAVECRGVDEEWHAVTCSEHSWVGTQYMPRSSGVVHVISASGSTSGRWRGPRTCRSRMGIGGT